MSQAKIGVFEESYKQLAELGKALAHPARVMILTILAKENRCVADLVERLPLSQSTVSQHLKELKRIGVIDVSNHDKKSFYCINKSRFEELSKYYAELNLLVSL